MGLTVFYIAVMHSAQLCLDSTAYCVKEAFQKR